MIVQKLLSESDSTWQRLTLTGTQIEELRSLCNGCISYVMGKRPKMIHYLKWT